MHTEKTMFGQDAIISALLAKVVDKNDPAISNVGVKNRCDAIGGLLNDLATQWDASVTATKLAGATDKTKRYPATFVEK